MKHDIFKMLLLCSIILGFSAYASSTYAADVSRKTQNFRIRENRNVNPAGINVAKAETAADHARASSLREKRNDRQGRFINDTLDDLNYSISLSAKDINRLSGLVDAMTPLEPPKREYDIRSLLDWYYRYSDWNKDMASECEDMLETRPAYADLDSLYTGLADNNRSSEKEVNDMVRSYQAELNNLFRILDRRQFLNERLRSLHARLSEIEEKLKDRHPQDPQKSRGEKKARSLKENISVVQTELISLVDIKEELLKHYVVMIEMGRDQAFWLGLKQGEYRLLSNLSKAACTAGPNDTSRLAEAYRGLIRGYENETKRLGRKIDELDRKRSGVSQVGSFRDLDRSEELSDFYMDRRQRYTDYINRLETRIGGAETELSQLIPGR
jgi:hypothetical protein